MNFNNTSVLTFLVVFVLACQPQFDNQEIKHFVAVDYKNPTTQKFKIFEERLNQLITQYQVSGLSVVLIENDSVVYRNGFGYSDIENKIETTSKTPYRIASLTKPIASTILLQLKEQGRLNLGDTIKNFLKGYEDYFSRTKEYLLEEEPKWAHLLENYDYKRSDITIWHHLTHTSEGVPGTKYKYNGFVFGSLSKVIEEKSGREFDELLQKKIFDPVKMDNTIASQNHRHKPLVLAALAKPYKIDENRFQQSEYPHKNVNAGAGIISSVEDLAKFDTAMNNDLLIKESTKTLAWQNQVTNNGVMIPYGLGWFVQEIDSTKVVWHYGWQPEAYSGLYLKIPEKHLSMILLSNCENLSASFSSQGMEEDLRKSPFAKLYLDVFNE